MKYIVILFIALLKLNFYGQTEKKYPLEELRERKKARTDALTEAIKKYDLAIKANSNDADSYFNRGICTMQLKGTSFSKDAVKDFKKAINLNSTRYGDTAYYLIGLEETYLPIANGGGIAAAHGAAIKNFTKAIEINPKFVAAYFERAKYWMGLRKIETAIEDFTKVIDLSPSKYTATAYYERGNCKYFEKSIIQGAIDKDGACLDWGKAAGLGNENAKLKLSQLCK